MTRRGRAFAALAAIALLAPLSACASEQAEVVSTWQPPRWSDIEGVAAEVTLLDAQEASQAPVIGEGTALADLEFFEGRIRNDRAGLQARYVEIPGSNPFNEQVGALVRAAAAATGEKITPQVFGAGSGLSDRGCEAGSLEWSADRVLTDPATGPKGGSGTAMTCDVVATFGDFVGVGFRTVTSTQGAPRDTSTVLYADVTAGETGGIWADDAAETLWATAVDQLRREAGALSGAALAAPTSEQLGLATVALGSVELGGDGGASFTIPAGLTAPELEAFGVPRTASPLRIEVDKEALGQIATERLGELASQQQQPFVGMPEWTAAQRVDCKIVACIALTFDDGPGAYTDRLLDELRSHGAAATFFMLGEQVAQNPDAAARVAADGHELGSHGMSHIDLTQLPLKQARAAVLDAKALIEDAAGADVTLFRPPYGAVTDKLIEGVDMPAVMWTIDTNDWSNPSQKALVASVVPAADPGDIVLMHDTFERTVKASGEMISGLQDRGFTLVTVTGMYGGDLPLGTVGW